MKQLARIIATSFYTGLFPFAPGTVGAFGALFFVWVFPGLLGLPLLFLTILIFFVGVWASTEVEKTDGYDASIINIDEVVGMWISLLFVPNGLPWYWYVIVFLIFRFFDIVKPPPVNQSQKLAKGWGVMMDDVFAGIYSNILLRVLLYFFIR